MYAFIIMRKNILFIHKSSSILTINLTPLVFYNYIYAATAS